MKIVNYAIQKVDVKCAKLDINIKMLKILFL